MNLYHYYNTPTELYNYNELKNGEHAELLYDVFFKPFTTEIYDCTSSKQVNERMLSLYTIMGKTEFNNAMIKYLKQVKDYSILTYIPKNGITSELENVIKQSLEQTNGMDWAGEKQYTWNDVASRKQDEF